MNVIKNKSSLIAYIGMFSAVAAVLSYIEILLPISIGIPGVKPGLANIVIILVLYSIDAKTAMLVNIIRILIVGFLYGNLFSILFSISGAIVSLISMYLVKKIKNITMLGVSITGGVMHNIGQIIIAAIIVNTYSIVYYLPVLLVSGILTGLIIAIVASIIYKRLGSYRRTNL